MQQRNENWLQPARRSSKAFIADRQGDLSDSLWIRVFGKSLYRFGSLLILLANSLNQPFLQPVVMTWASTSLERDIIRKQTETSLDLDVNVTRFQVFLILLWTLGLIKGDSSEFVNNPRPNSIQITFGWTQHNHNRSPCHHHYVSLAKGIRWNEGDLETQVIY